MGLTEACVHEDLRNILASNWSLRRELQKPDKTQKVIERRNFWAKQFSYWSLDCSLMQSYVQNPREKRWNKKSWIACSLSLSLSVSLTYTHTHTHTYTHVGRYGGLGSGTLEFINRMQVKEVRVCLLLINTNIAVHCKLYYKMADWEFDLGKKWWHLNC